MKPFLKPTLNKSVFLTALLLMFLSACNKDNQDLSLQDTLNEIVELTHQAYLHTEVKGGNENEPFYLPNDGLVEEYIAQEIDMFLKHGNVTNRLIRCLLQVELTDEQYQQARRAMNAYELRNKQLIADHRAKMELLKSGFETRRNLLISQVRSGEITSEEFRAELMQLRRRFANAVKNLKESNAGEFKASFQRLLQHLSIVLDEDQWLNFTSCLRGNLTP